MRTTVTLDPDVEHYIREACYQRKVSFKRVLNDTLREAFKPVDLSTPELLPPRSMGLAPGVDPKRLSELADDLEAEAFMAAKSAGDYGKKNMQVYSADTDFDRFPDIDWRNPLSARAR